MAKEIWTKEIIKKGFNRFFSEYGRLPRSEEIDKLPYLPSSRLIQKKYNGLEQLRAELGFTDVHFGKGSYRSTFAHQVNVRGSSHERTLETTLRQKFGEVFVHSERILSSTKVRVDFYIYSPSGNFAIDVFYSNTMRTLQSNINIKINKYTKHNVKIYLVSANNNISQHDLDVYVKAKRNTLPQNVHIVSLSNFISSLNEMGFYDNPIFK